MNDKLKIGLTAVIVFIILIYGAVKIYLFVGRKVDRGERELIWSAIKTVVPAVIAVMSGISTICGWFKLEQNEYSNIYTNVYLYFLICINSIVNSVDGYKEYKRKEEKIRN